MSAAVLLGHGDLDVLEVRADWPRPAAGLGEVVIEVRAAGVNNTDIWTRQGAYGLPGQPEARAGWRGPIAFPRVQGGDIAGVVVAVGPGVPTERIGERVLVDPAICRAERPDAPPVGLLGSEADGGFAQYVVVAAAHAHDVTGSPRSDEQLGCLPVAYGTAMGMLERGGLRCGETVLITGASGGVGLALVQLAAARGAIVIAVTTSVKTEQVCDAGASAIISRDLGDLADQVANVAPDDLDAVADVAGGPVIGQLMPLVREDGRWVVAGAVAGPVVSFDLLRLYLHNLRLIGSSLHTSEHFDRLAEVARVGSIVPRIAGRYPPHRHPPGTATVPARRPRRQDRHHAMTATETRGHTAMEWTLDQGFDTSEGTVRWRSFGEHGDPIVLVHGTPYSSFLWRDIAPALARSQRVYVFDHLGYGLSEKHEGQDLTLAAQARTFTRLLAHLDLADPRVVANDIGGAIALRALLLEGARYRDLTLFDCVSGGDWERGLFAQIREDHEVFARLPAYAHRSLVTSHLCNGTHLGYRPGVLEAYLEPWLGEDGQAAFYRQYRQLAQTDTQAYEHLLGDIHIPVRLLWGCEDRILPTPHGEWLRDNVQNTGMTWVDNAGHLLQEDAPAQLVSGILADR